MISNVHWWVYFIPVILFIVWRMIRSSMRRKHAYYHKSEREWATCKIGEDCSVAYSVFLIGDAGAPSLEAPEPNLVLLKKKLMEAGEKSAVVFLGDNIYPHGMPEKGDELRELAEQRIVGQMKMVKDIPGKIYFISGNHDWNKGRAGGYDSVLRQEKFVEEYLKRGNVFLPDNGCPDPVEIALTDEITMLVLNTQWWVQSGVRPIGEQYNCKAETEEEIFEAIEAIMRKNIELKKKILIAAHHPLYSYSFHGGKFPFKHHIFPITAAFKRAYIPLPIIGSIYPLFRQLIGAKEDMSHPRYRRLRERLLQIINLSKNVIYAAGHDHNLQYIKRADNHFIVSGAGCKVTYVRRSRSTNFTHGHKGFFKILYLNNGETYMEVWEPGGKDDEGYLAFRKKVQ